MKILAFDPSITDQGWSYVEYVDPQNPVVLDQGRIRTKSKEIDVLRYAKHHEGTEALLDTLPCDFVGVEIPPPQASYSAGLYPLWVHIAKICHYKRIPYVTWLPTSVKAYARRVLEQNGKMYKSDMVDAAVALFDVKRMNHNIADSLIINQMTYLLFALHYNHFDENELDDAGRFVISRTEGKKKVVEKGMIYKEGDLFFDLKDAKYDSLYT